MQATPHPADRVIRNPRIIPTLTADELFAADVELTNRAARLGRRGQVSRPHAAVRAALAAC